jgi:hypothetical protein
MIRNFSVALDAAPQRLFAKQHEGAAEKAGALREALVLE